MACEWSKINECETNGMYVPTWGIAGSHCICRITFWGTAKWVFKVAAPFYSSTSSVLEFQCLKIHHEIPEKSATNRNKCAAEVFVVLGTCVCFVCRFWENPPMEVGSNDGKRKPLTQFKLMSSKRYPIWYFCLSDCLCDFQIPFILIPDPQSVYL